MTIPDLHHTYLKTSNIALHTVLAGPEDGPPVILLHGFPEFWYGWRHQIPYLAARGYRVIAPDQRGYNLSDKPKAVNAYRISELTRDVVGLMDTLGYERVHLVGHDWGGVVAWWVATKYPDRLHKLVILNAPFPTLANKAYRQGNLRQILKSWYIFFIQIPHLPERLAGLNNWRALEQSMRRSGRPDTFTAEDFAAYKQAWSQPGAMIAMMNWYRAAARGAVHPEESELIYRGKPRITTPTLLLWGEQDVALEKSLAQESINLCDNGRLVFFPEATHWVQHDEADEVNRLIGEFLTE
ncbi:MAG: alpha/beta hydrolase [Chloroflexi bacterium]|nr:alpha/beta hydrolase [Chloroflexota bacterium]